jgi:hypothetical protein
MNQGKYASGREACAKVLAEKPVSFVGREAVNVFACIAVVGGLRFYAKTGMSINRAYTPTNMLKFVLLHTGKSFRRSQLLEAADALEQYARQKGGEQQVAGNIG